MREPLVNNEDLLKFLKEVEPLRLKNAIFYSVAWCQFLFDQSCDSCASIPKVAYDFRSLLVLKGSPRYLVRLN